jgi:RNA polymerase sigma-70 factor (ECF subfamily)
VSEERDEEHVWVERAKRDPEAFGVLYDRYVVAVYRYAFGKVKDHAHAEDVTAEIFRRALEAIHRFRWQDVPFSAWLFGIARHVVADHFRRSAREVVGVTFETQHGTDDPFIHSDVDLWQVVDELSGDQRQVIILRFLHDLSFRQIGKQMGRSEDAVKMMLYRALKKLRTKVVVEHDGARKGRMSGSTPRSE